MIFIVVKFTIRPEHDDAWLSRVEEFTSATRAEPGNLFFEWSRSIEVPRQYVLVEAFSGPEAGAAHVGSAHFRTAVDWMADVVESTPEIVSHEVPGDGWGPMGEITPR